MVNEMPESRVVATVQGADGKRGELRYSPDPGPEPKKHWMAVVYTIPGEPYEGRCGRRYKTKEEAEVGLAELMKICTVELCRGW